MAILKHTNQQLTALLLLTALVPRSSSAWLTDHHHHHHTLHVSTTRTARTTSTATRSSRSLLPRCRVQGIQDQPKQSTSLISLQYKAEPTFRPVLMSTVDEIKTETSSVESGSSEDLADNFNTADDDIETLTHLDLGGGKIFNIENAEEHKAFMEAHKDQLVILKVFAPWCRACKGLHPKFLALAKEPKYEKLPLVWAQLSIQHNKQFVKSIGVLALPTVQFYVGGGLVDTFPCGPSKVPILKRKLAQLVNQNVDPKTLRVKAEVIEAAAMANNTMTSAVGSAVASTLAPDVRDESLSSSSLSLLSPTIMAQPKNDTAESRPTIVKFGRAANDNAQGADAAPLISMAERNLYRQTIPHLATMSLADFDEVMDKARLLTFEAGSIIMREGKPGRTFYIIKTGEVEICQKTFAEDPLQAYSSSRYLGTVVNRLQQGDFFGERSLLTGEPRAASIRAVETTSCYAFDKQDFPNSSPLSGHANQLFTENELDLVDDKYGVSFKEGSDSFYARQVQQQIRDANVASQVRGSIHKPQAIKGVDTDDDILLEEEEVEEEQEQGSVLKGGQDLMVQQQDNKDAIFNVLRRFKMIRHVSKCFDYIELTNAKWGESGTRTRRAVLMSRLSKAQQEEYAETFDLIDLDRSGAITLLELKRVMGSVGDEKSDQELMDLMLANADVRDSSSSSSGPEKLEKKLSDSPQLSKQDFMGLMAEAEFYYLFRDIFKTLDPHETGYVKAGELDRVLCGIRDLISDDRKSIIDVAQDDMDMLIDYEQFTRMLLGSSRV